MQVLGLMKEKHPMGLPAAPRSHSASVGRRYWWPVSADSQLTYACASFQLTRCTGCREYPVGASRNGESPL